MRPGHESPVAPEFQIRPFARRHQAAARRLILEGLGERFGPIDETCSPDLDDIAASYLVPGHLFVVAHLGENLIGTGALVFVEEYMAQMVRVSVAREYRGCGIGTTVVEHLIHAARERDVTRLIVETNHDWYDAIALYRRCGFRYYDRDDVSVYMELGLCRSTSGAR